MMLPLAILLIEHDEDRGFLTQVYLQYYRLLYKVASEFFPEDAEETVEAVSDSVERMCRYCQKIKEVPSEKRAAYLVKIVRSVCYTRLREVQKQAMRRDLYVSADELENMEDTRNGSDMVFGCLCANDILCAFGELSDTDRRLMDMRYTDGMSYKEIAAILSVG